ncbi:MAG: hypothetical protein JSR80_02290 [Verrucomicrobia bacterium]|nr:hypothetical protein [Verrucomicrobiota bacterium]
MEALSAMTRSLTPFTGKASFLFTRHAATLSFGLLGTGCLVKAALVTRDWIALNGMIKEKTNPPLDEALKEITNNLTTLDNEESRKTIYNSFSEHRLTVDLRKQLMSFGDLTEKAQKDKATAEITKSLKGIISRANHGGAYAAAYAVLGLGFITCAAFSYRYLTRLPLLKPAA